MNYYKPGNFEELKRVINDYFDLRKYTITYPYNKNISIDGKRLDTRIYIRYEGYVGKQIVNISSISLDESTRRKGLLTNLVKEIARLEFINYIKIGGVSTPEMLAWCNKYKFSTDGSLDYYKKIR